MRVRDVISAKARGPAVETIRPGASVAAAVERMRSERVGALVVSPDGQTVDGLITETDIVRGLADHGSRLLDMRVSEVASTDVMAGSPDETISHVAKEMTRRRSRYFVAIEDGRLVGIVSIGDVVKHRLAEAELEIDVLRDRAIPHIDER